MLSASRGACPPHKKIIYYYIKIKKGEARPGAGETMKTDARQEKEESAQEKEGNTRNGIE